ncbi:hypothetical protein BGZ68_008752, partial [Mortierella alpina]
MARGFPFTPVKRTNVNEVSQAQLRHEVETICVREGTPLIIEDFHHSPDWNDDLFTFPHLDSIYGEEAILCRDQHGAADVRLLMREYIRQVHADCLPALLTASASPRRKRRAGTSPNYRNLSKPLLYAKDVSCPEHWRANLMESGVLPQFLTYMRENDLNALNEHAAENLFIYIGQAGTWTPAHVDQCASIGHNIMVWADN